MPTQMHYAACPSLVQVPVRSALLCFARSELVLGSLSSSSCHSGGLGPRLLSARCSLALFQQTLKRAASPSTPPPSPYSPLPYLFLSSERTIKRPFFSLLLLLLLPSLLSPLPPVFSLNSTSHIIAKQSSHTRHLAFSAPNKP